MATNRVHAGKRIRVLFAAAHAGGSLVYEKGFYGIVEESVAAGEYGYMILGDVWLLPRVPSTLAMGTLVAAPATAQATWLPLLAYTNHPSLNVQATTGWAPIGKAIATGNATVARILVFPPHSNLG